MTQYTKLTTDVKTAVWYKLSNKLNLILNHFIFSDADFKLAPFFDGYDRNRLDEHERELNVCFLYFKLK